MPLFGKSNSAAPQQQQATPSHHHHHPPPRKTSHDSQATAATEPLSPLRTRGENNGSANSSGNSSSNTPNTTTTDNGTPGRSRLNSRDIPRTYSGLYGSNEESLLPNMLMTQTPSLGIFLGLYLTLLAGLHLLCLVVSPRSAWTWTNLVHTALSVGTIHWIKGSLYDDYTGGEMAALTLWEQLEATQDSRSLREALMVVPCILCWVACHVADYDKATCTLNVIFWMITMLGKLPFMNGVRLFGINRTAGIDDNQDDDDDGASAAEPESLQDQSPPVGKPKTQ